MKQPFFTTGIKTYLGGKNASGSLHNIINVIPKHERFISGFLGNCAVMRYKKPAAVNIGIDIDAEIINHWQNQNTGIQLFNLDFLSIPNFALKPDLKTFIYLDPPYLLETRTGRSRYKHELTRSQHIDLLHKIESLKDTCMIAINCYENNLYHDFLFKWNKINYTTQTRGGTREETLYFNYEPPHPDALHDTRFWGDNFRTREKSQRRIKTILGKINRLDDHEKTQLRSLLKL